MQWRKVRWGRSARLLLPVLRESILKLLWWEHPALMDGPVQKRDAVSRNIQRSLAMQTQPSKLSHPVSKALHCTCVNYSGLGLKAIAFGKAIAGIVCPAFIFWRKFHWFGINLSCNAAMRTQQEFISKGDCSVFSLELKQRKKEAMEGLLIHTAVTEVTQHNAPHTAHEREWEAMAACIDSYQEFWFLPSNTATEVPELCSPLGMGSG